MKLLAILALTATALFAQAVRYNPTPVFTASGTPSAGGSPLIYAVPYAQVAVCNYPANGVPCTNYATTYINAAESASCPNNAQVVLQFTSNCTGTTDAFGNFGFWIAPGTYSYTLVTLAGTFGPYNFTAGTTSATSGVSSFNTRTGAVTLQLADVTALGTLSNNTSGSAATLSGINPIAQGGTGAGTAAAALINLLPTATRTGDVAYWNGTAWVLLAGNNTSNPCFTENSSGTPSWAACGAQTYPGAGIPNSTGSAWGTSYGVSGSGSVCLTTNCTMTTPALGTPSAVVLTHATGLPPGGVTAVQGNGSLFQLSTGSTTANDCAKWDANGNIVDSGAPCGSGGGLPAGTGIVQVTSSSGGLVTIGGDGALMYSSATLGGVSSVIGYLANANTWAGLQTFPSLGELQGAGSAPTVANGTGTVAVNTGSTNVAGSLTSSTSGTVTFTLTWASSLAYTHRAVCQFVDETTLADTVHTTQATVPTTTTLTATGTTVSGDIISYFCSGY